MNIAFFGSSLLSAYWNGAATYYRGILRALYQRGHNTTFYEPDAYERQQHRDMDEPGWARVVVYDPTEQAASRALEQAEDADVIVKASGVGVLDEFLEEGVLSLKRRENIVAFWDVDAPATLERIAQNPRDPFRPLIGRYDLVFTYGGGQPVIERYKSYGARQCVPIYNALDSSTHYPVPPEARFAADLSFLGNRLPDRENRVDEFFFLPAYALREKQFLLGGAGWQDKSRPANVRTLGHVSPADHNAFNCSSRVVLNVCRESMARCGFSPATRVFEAAGAGACILTDAWEGIDEILEPGREILVARSGMEACEILRSLSMSTATAIGAAARRRVLAGHTYAQRANTVEAVLRGERVSAVGALL